MLIFPQDYALHEHIFHPNNHHLNDFTYSDGEEFEQQIQSLIANASDRSVFSAELRHAIWDWRSACHLSPIRTNILRPLEAFCRKRVLELGSGCGIITRYLGELGGDVVALEASPARAKTTRLRTQDLDNVQVVCQRIEDFQSAEKFDVVTLIGVLQYARIFSNFRENAEKELLQHAYAQLRDDGILVVAIQNKLGLKYFSGYPESNVDIPFYGIENQYTSDGIIRFSHQEIKNLLSSVGLSHHMMLLPLPDYHMPVSILNPEAINEHAAFSVENFLSLTTSRDRLRPDWIKPAFSLEKAWESVHEAGLTPHLANSFLVVAAKNEATISRVKHMFPDLACHYSVEREPAFTCVKRFIAEEAGIFAKRVLLQPGPAPDLPLTHHIDTEVYEPGKLWWSGLVTIVNQAGWSTPALATWAEPWIDLILQHADPSKPKNKWRLSDKVPGYLFDFTPLNCIEKQTGKLTFIDKEWELGFSLNLSYILIRGLFGSLTSVSSCAKPASEQSIQVIHLVTDILKRNGFKITSEDINSFTTEELKIQRLINQNVYRHAENEWRQYIPAARLVLRDSVRDAPITRMEYDLLTHDMAHLVKELQGIQHSFSWQVTKPLRSIKQWLKYLNPLKSKGFNP